MYEETLASPQKFLREVFEFLEVDSTFSPANMKRYYEMEIPRVPAVRRYLRDSPMWKAVRRHCPQEWQKRLKSAVYFRKGSHRMDPEERRFLVEYYRADVERLQGILHRDLSAWLR